jgi:hypothetical protein
MRGGWWMPGRLRDGSERVPDQTMRQAGERFPGVGKGATGEGAVRRDRGVVWGTAVRDVVEWFQVMRLSV